MKRTTKADFDLFKKECEKWIEFFGLKEWDILIEHIDSEESWWARCGAGYITKSGEIHLNKNWDEQRPLDKYHIKKNAFHEVCHLLFWDLRQLAHSRFLEEDEIENKEHEMISKLINSVFKRFDKKE